jgi:hypothetical protein
MSIVFLEFVPKRNILHYLPTPGSVFAYRGVLICYNNGELGRRNRGTTARLYRQDESLKMETTGHYYIASDKHIPRGEPVVKGTRTPRHIFSFTVLLLLICLTTIGCSEQPSKKTPVDAVTLPTATSVVPTAEPYVRKPTSPLMDQVWQPPEPERLVELPTSTEVASSPDAMVIYQVVGLNHGDLMKITQDGQVSVYGYRDSIYTLALAPERLQALLENFDRADFFNLSDSYKVANPPGVIVEMDYVTVTYTKDGRTKSITTRGTDKTPSAYVGVEAALSALADEARNKGTVTSRPPALIDILVLGTEHSWSLDVDSKGGLYYRNSSTPIQMSSEDLTALKQAIEDIGSLGTDQWYAPPRDIRDVLIKFEHQAVVTTYSNGQSYQTLDMVSGASIPAGLQTVMDQLVMLYDKYAPAK